MTKQELRVLKQQERDGLDAALHSEWSQQIAMNISQCFEYQRCETLHVYCSMRSEVDTKPIREQAWRDGKRVVVPYVAAQDDMHLHHTEYRSGDAPGTDALGIPVPAVVRPVTVEELRESQTLILVPMLAFNQRLYRLGYGKGYYDRFLTINGVAKFGVAFSFQFADELQPEPHDVPCDAIVTEQGAARRISTS
ncbi:MAG: 5-formyltetrahydrofolate cyclo-ligase [Candidatus Kapabacteria bacterium]|nr:5-formyltetrahydrofolate cyclo-ligase [Candidatus Kapabacteria bacterium]